ncbi:hypothetical protein [Roseiconus lacunae]|uniref:DUF4405 domain-containing protein n=1 Tax=Roseiconus lacunae TaxID=2605694 RepID=A0ABT7PED5_9BACT|nr:hypothetical protein [Roseiconus lacunae]MDM4014865.1 hypothetical protein [Roseiconus lacunae]
MSRHVINLSLCFALAVMLITGGAAYWLPFSLLNARLHVCGGLVFVALITFHLVDRIAYLQKLFALRLRGFTGWHAFSVLSGVAVWLYITGTGTAPSTWLMKQSYEARHRREIVRASPLVGFGEPSEHNRLIFRTTNPATATKDNPVELSVWLGFDRDLDRLPSIAVWAESMTGTMIETLFLEDELSYGETVDVHGIRKRRGDVLPIWRHKYSLVSGTDPNGEIDVVSGATERHQYSLDGTLVAGQGKEFIVCVELNVAGDPNDAWPDPVLGQPSLLYTAIVEVDAENSNALLELTAHGGGAEVDGNLQYDLGTITTAKTYADLFLVKLSTVRSHSRSNL